MAKPSFSGIIDRGGRRVMESRRGGCRGEAGRPINSTVAVEEDEG